LIVPIKLQRYEEVKEQEKKKKKKIHAVHRGKSKNRTASRGTERV
jgi:hypothetical protein